MGPNSALLPDRCVQRAVDETAHAEALASLVPRVLRRHSASRVVFVLDSDAARLPSMSEAVQRFATIVAERAEMICINDGKADALRTLVYGWVEVG